MANISGLLGTAGGFKGTGVDAPMQLTNPQQLDTAYSNNNLTFQQQQDLLKQLQSQNGLSNLSSVYNQNQNIANGTGPNPAQAQLAQATAANTANQAALMAGQRGTSANAGLLARQASMQGSANQQSSASQAATLQAQQSLAAINNMGNIANQQVQNQIGQTNANTAAAQTEQANLLGAGAKNAAINAQLIGDTAQQQAAVGGGASSGAGSAMSSMFAGGGEVEKSMYAEGTPNASSIPITPPPQAPQAPGKSQPQSFFGRYLQSMKDSDSQPQSNNPYAPLQKGLSDLGKGIGVAITNYRQHNPQQPEAPQSIAPDMSNQSPYAIQPDNEGTAAMARGGKVPALVSPGEQYIPPKDVKKVEKGANPLAVGERIPGNPKYPGNDYRNDTVPKTLESGGIVIPNKIMQAKNPHFEAMKFVHAHIAKHRKTLPSRKK